MALLEDEAKHPTRILLLIGIPSFALAVFISMFSHYVIHAVVSNHACGATVVQHDVSTDCPASSFVATLWTFLLAIASFSVYMHYPRNLFVGAMAFVNAAFRLPQTVTAFFQLLFNTAPRSNVDEVAALSVLGSIGPTIGVVILWLFSMITLFLTIIIVHDTKTVPWKWLVASILFLLLSPLEKFMLPILSVVLR